MRVRLPRQGIWRLARARQRPLYLFEFQHVSAAKSALCAASMGVRSHSSAVNTCSEPSSQNATHLRVWLHPGAPGVCGGVIFRQLFIRRGKQGRWVESAMVRLVGRVRFKYGVFWGNRRGQQGVDKELEGE
ncbi:hypothetical protein PLICRDRAFT_246297 [Plicaturopsis crispa FD-325 SS-3]|nr:hypothetical protein PLICRDRAFT_246297 [Plicaturopsis crispa FD-325 SS-3]